jgi:NTE family protein
LGDIGAGEPVGEFAFFTKEDRMASVIAIRDSVVLRFNQKNYDQLVRHNPGLASMLIRFIIKRMKEMPSSKAKPVHPKILRLYTYNLQTNLRNIPV